MNLGGCTATGPRDANEDNYYVIDFSEVRSFTNGITSFVMVSDGMGGYQGGDVASGLAVSSAESYIGHLLDMAAGNQVDLDAAAALTEISQNAHEAILAETRERGNASMGATFVGAFLSPTHAWIGHVGDSRAYLVRDGEATQLTEDHSQVGRMLSRGLITEEEAQNHPARNRIERALGFSDATPEMNEVDLLPGDALLLCSDGVYTVLDSKAIGACVSGERDAESAASRVVKRAISKGTDDNSTAAIALNVESERPRATKRNPQPTIRTSAVSQPRHAAARSRSSGLKNSQARGGGRNAGRGAAARLSGDWPSWVPAILIAAIAALAIAAILVVVLNPFAKDSDGSVASSAQNSQQESLGAGEGDSQNGEDGGSDTASEPTSGAKRATSTFTSTISAQYDGEVPMLKYISTDPEDIKDSEGYEELSEIAMLFSYQTFEIPDPITLSIGKSVDVESESSSYGRPGQLYRALDDRYRQDLLDDCKRYNPTTTRFESGLSAIVDPQSYLVLVSGLSRYDESLLDRHIAKLALDAEFVSGS